MEEPQISENAGTKENCLRFESAGIRPKKGGSFLNALPGHSDLGVSQTGFEDGGRKPMGQERWYVIGGTAMPDMSGAGRN